MKEKLIIFAFGIMIVVGFLSEKDKRKEVIISGGGCEYVKLTKVDAG